MTGSECHKYQKFRTTNFQKYVSPVTLRRESRSRLGWQEIGKQLHRFGCLKFCRTFQPGNDITEIKTLYLLVCFLLVGVWVPIFIPGLLHGCVEYSADVSTYLPLFSC
jgi:hypothetical protein